MGTPSPNFPLNHPALKRYYLLTEYGLTDRDLEDMEGKSLTYMAVITKGLELRQKIEKKEVELEK